MVKKCWFSSWDVSVLKSINWTTEFGQKNSSSPLITQWTKQTVKKLIQGMSVIRMNLWEREKKRGGMRVWASNGWTMDGHKYTLRPSKVALCNLKQAIKCISKYLTLASKWCGSLFQHLKIHRSAQSLESSAQFAFSTSLTVKTSSASSSNDVVYNGTFFLHSHLSKDPIPMSITNTHRKSVRWRTIKLVFTFSSSCERILHLSILDCDHKSSTSVFLFLTRAKRLSSECRAFKMTQNPPFEGLWAG